MIKLFYGDKMYQESQSVELKKELTNDIKKEIIAFANTNTGTIYIGIDDGGNIIGLNNPKKDLEAVSNIIRDGITSDLTLYTNAYIEVIDNKDVIIINVVPGPNKPYYITEKGLKPSGVYLRHGSISVPATDEVIKKLLRESNSNSFENEISLEQHLNMLEMVNYFTAVGIEPDIAKHKTLRIRNADNLYTNLGLLLSDECPYTIKCAIYNGTDKIEFRDRKEFSGSILKQIHDVNAFLDLFNKTRGKITGLERIDTRDYPEYALREVLLNAVIHRDYNFNGSILVHMFDDRIEILSIGGLVKGLNMDDIFLGVSESRNPNLANIFFRLKYVENFGTGIGRIMESYKPYGIKPIILSSENAFLVTLLNVNYEETETKKSLPTSLSQEEQIIDYLKKYNKISRTIVENMLNISKTRANNILKELVKKEIISLSGNGKNIVYILK